jgi:hypothetical protein
LRPLPSAAGVSAPGNLPADHSLECRHWVTFRGLTGPDGSLELAFGETADGRLSRDDIRRVNG